MRRPSLTASKISRRIASGLRLAVHDSGRGIAAAQQRAVFEEVYQVVHPGRDHAKGLGLGLAIVQRLANLLDAPLAMRSRLGQASAFSLALRRVRTGRPRRARPAHGAGRGVLSSALITVIDDEALILDATRVLLEALGCTVLTASSGAEAMERLAASPRTPAAIVCDHRLRGTETGIEVIVALRDEFNRDIPALLVTGDTSPAAIKALLRTRLPVLHYPFKTRY